MRVRVFLSFNAVFLSFNAVFLSFNAVFLSFYAISVLTMIDLQGVFWLHIAAAGGAKAVVENAVEVPVPPNQQGPICLQPCADSATASHWILRTLSPRSGVQLVSASAFLNLKNDEFCIKNKEFCIENDMSSADDTTQCLTVTGPHAIRRSKKIRRGGLDCLPCNSSAPLQGWKLSEASPKALTTTATAAELATVGVGTRGCQCGKGMSVDVNAHQGTASTTCQMGAAPAMWTQVKQVGSAFQLQAASYGIKGMCIAHISSMPPPPPPPPLAPALVTLPVPLPAGTVCVQTKVATLASATVTVAAGSTVRVPGTTSTTYPSLVISYPC